MGSVAMKAGSRMTAEIDDGFVVFLIGMRVRKWWRPDLYLPVARAMGRMLAELSQRPELGLLGFESGGLGNPSMMVQYWRSLDALLSYAHAKDQAHLPAWVDFRRKAASTDAVGIWHETFVVQPGQYECLYGNFPGPFGLGRAGRWVPATGKRESARARLGQAA